MNTATPVEKIRAVIAAQLSRFGASDVSTIREALLIHNGMFCGRKFRCEGYEVVWFIEEDEIKFFGPCGDLLLAASAISCILDYDQSSSYEPRRAA